jgi:hypothetical protein
MKALVLLLLLGAGTAAADCEPAPPGAQVIKQGTLQATWTPEPAPIVVAKPFALLITLCPADAELKRVDATMPEHRHGMNYRPGIEPLGPGRWRAQGLLWHMGGRWELRLDVQHQGQTVRLVQSVPLP